MTNQERIQSHNEQLAEIKEIAAGLPDAGGSGGVVETCTVTVRFMGGAAGYGVDGGAVVIYNKVVSGVIQTILLNITQDITVITDVARDSSIAVCTNDNFSIFGGFSVQNFTTLEFPSSSYLRDNIIAGSTNASEATIIIGS